MTAFTLTHADIVTRDTVFKDGSLVVEDGHIASVGGASKGNEIDLSGQWLLPGLIDLHCDAIEKEVEPRPGVMMPLDLAIRQIDTRNLVAGISTIFHCFSFAGEELGVRNPELATRIARLVANMSEGLSVRNLVHARFEVSHPEAMPLVSELMRDEVISLLSFMDHTPGQGQFREDGAYKRFLMKTYQKTDEEAVALIDAKTRADDGSRKVMDTLARQALGSGIGLISHDDDTPEKVRQMHDLGVRISEFPVTLEAGREARRLGMHALVGAPNVVRGRSQSGGVSALEVLADGAANCLCSDYIPATILPAVFQVAERLGWDLTEAVALATANPAEAVGQFDRGRIAEGKLADLMVVHQDDKVVEVTDVWVGGNPRLSRSGGKWN
jgi:alpha-D-ribose 1-methylphosphonate 5-triphosphate diphosphatase